MSTFLVDSNFFIQAHRAIYPLDIAPSFWNKVQELAQRGTIVSIDKVKKEIYKNEDELKIWCENSLPSEFFKDTSSVLNEYALLAKWANSMSHHYKTEAIQEFLDFDMADAWLVAFGMNQNIPVVTYERSEPYSKKKIKIPDVCIHFSVSYLNTIEMFRQIGERF